MHSDVLKRRKFRKDSPSHLVKLITGIFRTCMTLKLCIRRYSMITPRIWCPSTIPIRRVMLPKWYATTLYSGMEKTSKHWKNQTLRRCARCFCRIFAKSSIRQDSHRSLTALAEVMMYTWKQSNGSEAEVEIPPAPSRGHNSTTTKG